MHDKSVNQSSATNGRHVDVQSTVAQEFHDFLADMEDLVKDATSLTGEDLARVKEKVRKQIAAAKGSAEEVGNNLAARARKTAEQATEYVHDHSWQTVGIGAAVGVVLGLLLARRA